jgi:hypothetical protein
MLTKNDKRSVVVGLVSSALFLALIQPIMICVWHFLSSATPIWIEHYTYEFYQSAALGSRNWLEVVFFGMGFAIFTGLVPGLIIGTWRATTDRNDERRTIDEQAKRLKRAMILGIVTFIILALITFHFLLLAFIDLQLTTSFNQRLTVLAPKISIQEEREFRASWASMQNKTDYDSINRQLEDTAAKTGIKLPKTLY